MSLSVTLYTQPSCMACRLTKKHMDTRGIKYEEQLLDTDDTDLMEAISELELTTAPVVCVTTDEGENLWFDGYRPDRIDGLVKTFGKSAHSVANGTDPLPEHQEEVHHESVRI